MKHLRFPVILLLACMLLLFSCKSENENANNSRKPSVSKNTEGQEGWNEDEESIIYLFPAPGEVLERFHNTEMAFEGTLLNPVTNKDQYLTTRSKALNLGIYFTDFAYAVVFERQQEAMDYLEVLEDLSTEVNITPTVYESLMERTETNIGKRDSLLNISRDMFFSILEFLEEGQMKSTMALVSAGAYIEAMYVALQSVDEYKTDHPVLKHITELRYPMNNLLERARATSNDPNVSSIVIYLVEISEIFDELETMTAEPTVVKDSANAISIMGGSEKTMNREEFLALREKITEIRSNITGN